MKRPRSYGEDLSSSSGSPKNWSRRDSDRSSSHRRFSHHGSDSWKASSSRKRFDHDFDRRPDRYWDAPDRRFGYGERIRRSESFSVPRREFPKGFRSERERSRREDGFGASWRRAAILREEVSEEVRSVSSGRGSRVASEDRSSRVASEDRSKSRSKEDSGEARSRSVEVKKPVEGRRERKEISGDCEMEEGELEPEPARVEKAKLDRVPVVKVKVEECRVSEKVCENQVDVLNFDKRTTDGENIKEVGVDREMVTVENRFQDESDLRKKGFSDGLEMDREKPKVLLEQSMVVGDGKEMTENVKERQQRAASPVGEPGMVREEQSVDENKDTRTSMMEAFPLVVDVDEKKQETGLVEEKGESGVGRQVDKEVERMQKQTEVRIEQKEQKAIDLENETGIAIGISGSCNDTAIDIDKHGITLELMPDRVMNHGSRDKGKRLAVSVSDEARSFAEDDGMEGQSSRGFELIFSSEATKRAKAGGGGIVIGKRRDDSNNTLEPLDLSLGLPGVSSDPPNNDPNPKSSSLRPASSMQSLPSSFRTESDGFTASLSMSGSQTFIHNPSCSLTRNSVDNYEHSVGSRPIFNGIDQASDGTVWRGLTSNELKRKGPAVPLYQRLIANNNNAHQSSGDAQVFPKSTSLSHQPNFSVQNLSTHTRTSHETTSERNKEKKVLTKEGSSSSLFRDSAQVIPNGNMVFEKNLSKIITEPVHIINRTIQGMTEQSVLFLKEAMADIITNRDKHEEFSRFQEALRRRSDLSVEILSGGHRVLLEILVAIKTGLPDFLRGNNSIPSDLVEIFMNLKCRNPSCRSNLPVDECDCRVCSKRTGFCSACMCLLCSKFDMASNTCSWVGCDVCLHWCHTDCALRDSRIRNGRSLTGMQGTEMQFTCVACNHPSEMFGFVKEVFKTCAKDWRAETLAKELEYVRRIFSGSADIRGKTLYEVADHLLLRLGNKANLSEVLKSIMEFFADCDSKLSNKPAPAIPPAKDVPPVPREGSNRIVGNGILVGSSSAVGPSIEGAWRATAPTEKFPTLDVSGVRTSVDRNQLDRQATIVKKQNSLEKKPVDDELESIVKFKQAEAKMYQTRADEARKEAEGLKRIAVAKNEKIDEEYTGKITKLGLLDAEERRRQKLEEFQALERAHRDYFNMKMRMEADIKDLMLKMEATKHNLNSLH